MAPRSLSSAASTRRALILAAILLGLGLPASGEGSEFALHRGTRLRPATVRTGELFDALRGRTRAKALLLNASYSELLFPVLGKIPGWQSDLMLINHKSTPQSLFLVFLEQGKDNTEARTFRYELPERSFVNWTDFFATALDLTGIGSILIFAIDDAGDSDDTARIDGSARLYQTDPAGGTLSQLFPAVPIADAPAGMKTTALGLRSDERFRTNAGVVNLDGASRTFHVEIIGHDAFDITVPPYSMMQVRLPGDGTYGAVALQFTTDSDTWWSSYGASVDNISGDSWSSHGALDFASDEE
jgi:hypothetical protein